MTDTCPFCSTTETDIVCRNKLAYCIYDRFPVAQGHSLVIPHRHFPGLFEATPDEVLAIYALLKEQKELLGTLYQPAGFNVGVNIGRTAGQTIFHLHVHLIPRYRDDHPDPRGGVRHVIPGKGRYP